MIPVQWAILDSAAQTSLNEVLCCVGNTAAAFGSASTIQSPVSPVGLSCVQLSFCYPRAMWFRFCAVEVVQYFFHW